MAEQAAQHVIPSCYLKDWCDPNTPTGESPYIWRISRDGATKRRRSPEKSFRSNNRYTIKLPNGDRDLTVENTLGGLENKFVSIRTRIRRQETLTTRDRANLCLFTAAMQARTLRAGDHWRGSQQKHHDVVVSMEQQHNLEPIASSKLAQIVETAPQDMVMLSLEMQAPLYFGMHMSVFITDDPIGFITSDTPCVWFNPKAHTMPPMYRTSGLIQRDIEVSLPLTPHHLLFISHKEFPFYVKIRSAIVDEMNRLRRAYCTEEFVSWKGETRPSWFELGERPADAWENTEEGKKSIRQHAEWQETKKTWEQTRK